MNTNISRDFQICTSVPLSGRDWDCYYKASHDWIFMRFQRNCIEIEIFEIEFEWLIMSVFCFYKNFFYIVILVRGEFRTLSNI